MPLSNTGTRYGGVAKTFHWLTALLILTLIPVALVANRLPYETGEQLTTKAWLFSLHKTLGVTVFFVALLRILWAITQPKPALLNADHKIESWAAETAHWLLYGSLVLAPMSGWIHHAATSGFAPIWWPLGQGLPLVPKSETLAAITAGLHSVFTKVMVITILAHIGGALKHHVIDKDATLRRMLPGHPALPSLDAPHHSAAPLISALVIWAAALGLGGALGVYHSHGPAPVALALEDVASDWTVEDGSIAIKVTQFGTVVEGSFVDWTAAISFDETTQTGKAGTVEATISIPSLILGSVTSQALGADFFDATTFPTAVFAGDIMHASDGFEAVGTLTIRDKSIPLILPFALTISESNADMLGRVTLDRRDFSIGDNMADESSLAFEVSVVIALTATQAQ